MMMRNSYVLGLSLLAASCVVHVQPTEKLKNEQTLVGGMTIVQKYIDTDGNGKPDAVGLVYSDPKTGNSIESIDRNIDGMPDYVVQREPRNSLEMIARDDDFDGFFERATITDKDSGPRGDKLLRLILNNIDGTSRTIDYSLDGRTKIFSFYLPGSDHPAEMRIEQEGRSTIYWVQGLEWLSEDEYQRMKEWKEEWRRHQERQRHQERLPNREDVPEQENFIPQLQQVRL